MEIMSLNFKSHLKKNVSNMGNLLNYRQKKTTFL